MTEAERLAQLRRLTVPQLRAREARCKAHLRYAEAVVDRAELQRDRQRRELELVQIALGDALLPPLPKVDR